MAVDMIALMDALKIQQAVLGGLDQRPPCLSRRAPAAWLRVQAPRQQVEDVAASALLTAPLTL
jgi:hypothetical protein